MTIAQGWWIPMLIMFSTTVILSIVLTGPGIQAIIDNNDKN